MKAVLASNFRGRAGQARRFAGKLTRRVQSALSPPPVILCYHRVFEPECDPHLLSVTPAHFREHLEVVRRLAHPISLDHLADSLAHGDLPRRGVTVTFDDGYLDNFDNALPILQETETPATIYIATGYIGTNREFWWDDLERLVFCSGKLPAHFRLEINGRTWVWNLPDDSEDRTGWNVLDPPNERTPRQQLFCELHAALYPLPAIEQDAVLEQLRSVTRIPARARPSYRCVTPAELRTLAAEPLITLGAHTISHCDLATRNGAEQQSEIAGSRYQLEQVIGKPVLHFSYPYGSYNEAAVSFCNESGFHSGVTCAPEPVRRSDHPQRLPRLLVRDWDGAEFQQHLKEFLCA